MKFVGDRSTPANSTALALSARARQCKPKGSRGLGMMAAAMICIGIVGCDDEQTAVPSPDAMEMIDVSAVDGATDMFARPRDVGPSIDAASDARFPARDAALDSAAPDAEPDAEPDAAAPAPDAAPDAAAPAADMFADSSLDAAPTPADLGVELDAAVSPPDAAPPIPDAAFPRLDAALEPDAADLCTTFDEAFQPLLDEQCVQCHGGAAPSVQLNLSRGRAIAALTNRASVWGEDLVLLTPGNPGASFVIEKLRANPRHGLTMPPGGPVWPEDMIWHLANWIAESAPEQAFNCDGPVLPEPGLDQGVVPDLDAGVPDADLPDAADEDAASDDECTTFAETVQPMLNADCIQCHNPQNLLGGLDLSPGSARESLVDQSSQWDPELLLVSPGQPRASFLLEKLGAAPRHGEQMPLGARAWSDERMNALTNWIAWGAPADAYCGQAEIPDPPDAGLADEDAGDVVDLDAGVDENPAENVCSNFEDDLGPLIESTCGQCHIDVALGGLDLSPDNLFEHLINAPSAVDPTRVLVVPGDVDQSYLVEKMLPNPRHGAQMPLIPPVWTAAQLGQLTDWIAAGAPIGDYDCEEVVPPEPAPDECLTFDDTIQPMLDASCVRCHSNANPLGELNLSRGNAIDELVRAESIWDSDLRLVQPFEPGESFLIEKLRANPAHGRQMPLGDAAWTDAEIDELVTWIEAGAHAREYDCEDAFVPPEVDAAPDPVEEDAGVDAQEDCLTFDDTIQPLFDQGCTGCHSPNGGNQGRLNLAPGASMDALIGVNSRGNPGAVLVVAGETAASYLVEKLRPNPSAGDRMPPFGAAWNEARMALIAQWIDAGAPRGEYACGDVQDAGVDAAPEPEPDAAPPDEELDPPVPIVASIEPRPDIESVRLSADPHRYGAPAVDTVLVQSAAGVRHLSDGDPISVPGVLGDVRRIEVIDGQIVMVLTDQGLYAVNGRFGRLSPLGDAIDGPALDLVDASHDGQAALWITTADTLYRWTNGGLEAVDLPDVVVGNPRLTYGAVFQGQPALWLASDDLLLAIVVNEGEINAWIIQEDVTFDLIASDIQGAFWGTIGRELYRRASTGRWVNYVHDDVINALGGHRDAQMLWFTGAGGTWGHLNGAFWPFPEIAADGGLAVAARDRLVTAGPTGVHTVTPQDLPAVERARITWDDHIGPLADDQCGLCHGEGQNAHPLFEAAQWVAEFDEILSVVQTGQMPLASPPLSPREVQLIEDWAAGGFLINGGD